MYIQQDFLTCRLTKLLLLLQVTWEIQSEIPTLTSTMVGQMTICCHLIYYYFVKPFFSLNSLLSLFQKAYLSKRFTLLLYIDLLLINNLIMVIDTFCGLIIYSCLILSCQPLWSLMIANSSINSIINSVIDLNFDYNSKNNNNGIHQSAIFISYSILIIEAPLLAVPSVSPNNLCLV